MKHKKNVIDVLQERGFVDQITHAELKDRAERPMVVYSGIDPTAESLHLGNLLGLIALAWFQRYGHTPIALIGGATGKIGDPSGKSSERNLLDDVTLDKNISAIERFLKKILFFPQGPKPLFLNNNEWLGHFSFISFLKDVGKHFRVGQMLAKESVRARLQSDEGMSFTEFCYQILQAYDFYYLSQHHGVCLQLGGSDQWGNITAGCELNRKLGGAPIFGLTWPLLTRSDGKKFGKSEEGAIWLSVEKFSAYQFYQYLIQVPDADVIRLLKMLTFLDLEEIQEIESQMPGAPHAAQKRLSQEVTRFVHGEEGLKAAEKVTASLSIGAPGARVDLALSAENLESLAFDMPSVSLFKEQLIGKKWVEVVAQIGFVSSKGEALRLIQNHGAYLNQEKVTDPALILQEKDLIEGKFVLVGAGKKNKMLIRVEKN